MDSYNLLSNFQKKVRILLKKEAKNLNFQKTNNNLLKKTSHLVVYL